MKLTKRFTCITLAACMAAGCFSGCGKDGSNEAKPSDNEAYNVSAQTPQHYFKADYLTDLPAGINDNTQRGIFHGNKFYYQATDSEMSISQVYAYDMYTGENNLINDIEGFNPDPTQPQKYVLEISADNEGNVYELVMENRVMSEKFDFDPAEITKADACGAMIENWGYTANDVEKALASDGRVTQRYTDSDGTIRYDWIYIECVGSQYGIENRTAIYKYDSKGNLVSTAELFNNHGDNNLHGAVTSFAADKDGNLVCIKTTIDETAGAEETVSVAIFDPTGKEITTKESKDINAYCTLLADKEGNVRVLAGSEEGNDSLSYIDSKTGEISGTVSLADAGITTCLFGEGDTVIYPYDTSLYEFNLKTGEKNKYMSLVGCGVPSNSMQSLGVLEDGTLAGFTKNWSSLSDCYEANLVRFSEVSAEEWNSKTTITLACDRLAGDVEQLVLNVNKNGGDYNIDVIEYSGSLSSDDESKKEFYTALASDPNVDIIALSEDGYSTMRDFGKMGLLTDLSPLMENSDVIKKSDVFENVIDLCTVNDKLVALPREAYLYTWVAPSWMVGTEPGWSVSDALELIKSKPEGTMLIDSKTRAEMLSDCLCLNYSRYMDINNGTCDFDNDDFKQLLTLTSLLPEETAFSEELSGGADRWESLAKGKILCSQTSINGTDELQVYKTVFGESATLIGFPAAEGNGSLLKFGTLVGITKNAEDASACFDLLSPFFKGKEYKPGPSKVIPMPIRKDSFDSLCESWRKSTGDKKRQGYYLNEAMGSVEIEGATQTDLDTVKNIFAGATGAYDSLPADVMNIIQEEAASFYSGEKTIDEITPLIQSRVSIYLSETK